MAVELPFVSEEEAREHALIMIVKRNLFGNLVHYRQHCMSETDDAKQVIKFMRDHRELL